MRNVMFPAEVFTLPRVRMACCMPTAALTAAAFVLVSVEEEQEGVAPEFDEPAAQRVGDRQQALEASPQDFGDFLGADLSESGQTFGHGRET